MRLRAKVVGAGEAAEGLNQMGEELAGQALVDAVLAGAKILVNTWKRYIRQRAHRTGTYMRSIHEEVTRRVKGFVQVTVGTDIVDPPYPFWLEFGTKKMRPRPTARPAFDESEDEVAKEIEDNLLQSVDRHWR